MLSPVHRYVAFVIYSLYVKHRLLYKDLLIVMMRQALGWQAGPFALSTAYAILSEILCRVPLCPLWFKPSGGQAAKYYFSYHR